LKTTLSPLVKAGSCMEPRGASHFLWSPRVDRHSGALHTWRRPLPTTLRSQRKMTEPSTRSTVPVLAPAEEIMGHLARADPQRGATLHS
jgi:hypothetical protein